MLSTTARTNDQEIDGCGWIGQSEQRRARIPVDHGPINSRLIETGVDGEPDGVVSVRTGLNGQPGVFQKTHGVEHRKPGVKLGRQVGHPI